MQWYGGNQLNSQRAARILLHKLPQVLQRRLAAEQFDMLSVEFIYQKAQDYMNWLLVSPTGQKDSLGDFMDLDTCVVNKVGAFAETLESLIVHAIVNSRQLKPMLDWDSIKWQNIDGPRSLMVAQKKLIATSSQFRKESQTFLRHQLQFFHMHPQIVAVHFDSGEEGDFDGQSFLELSDEPLDSTCR